MPNYLIQKDTQNLIPFTGTSAQADVYARDFTVYTANSDGSKTLYGGPTSAYRVDSRPKMVALTDRSDTTPSVVDVPYLGRDSAGNITSLVSGDGSFLYGPVTSGTWMKVPSIFRLRITGTGTMQMDSNDSLGNITLLTFPLTTYTGETDKIEFPYAGDDAVAIRVTLTGTLTCEVI